MKTREGEEQLAAFCRMIIKRLKNDWDIVIGICGEEGVGKSTLALLMGLYIDQYFTPERNVLASPNVKDIHESLTSKLPKYSVVVVDEAIKVMYKLGWHSKSQLLLNTVMSVCRKENKVALLCMPRFMDFNEYNRQHRVKIWIEVISRGHALVFVKDRSPFINDVWHLKENQKLYEKATKGRLLVEMGDEEYLNALRLCKTYAFEFKYDDVPEKTKKEYKILKDQVAATLEIDEVKGLGKLYREAVKACVGILYTENGMKQRDIASESGLSLYTINRFLSELGLRRVDNPKPHKKTKVINS